MASSPILSLDDVRADREETLREQAAKKAKYEEDKAALDARFEAEMKELSARLADLEAVERVLLRRHQRSRPAPNGCDHQKEPDGAEDPTTENKDHAAEDDETNVEGMTQKELVLAAIRRLHERQERSMRYHIDQFIRREFHREVPPTNISTYLRRLKAEGLVDNPGEGQYWCPAGRASQ